MRKHTLILVVLTLLLAVVLSACGATSTSTGSSSGSMPGMDMSQPTTAPAKVATTAPATTTAPAMAATSGTMPGMNMGGTANDPMTLALKDLKGAEFETKFMQFMIGHHQSAIDMAKLIPTNTKRPELIKLGQEITSAQTKEIGDMTKWLADWYSAKPVADAMSVPGMMEMMGDMDKLKSAKDDAFDKQFLTMMLAHHQQAVNMSKLIPDKTQRPALVKLGQDIIKAQTSEIEQMMGWQKAWFKTS